MRQMEDELTHETRGGKGQCTYFKLNQGKSRTNLIMTISRKNDS